MFEFDINREVQELIQRYENKFNLSYRLEEMSNCEVRRIFGHINQFVFPQIQTENSYRIRLTNLRKLLQGVKYFPKSKK